MTERQTGYVRVVMESSYNGSGTQLLTVVGELCDTHAI
jgi:hypothetical protein